MPFFTANSENIQILSSSKLIIGSLLMVKHISSALCSRRQNLANKMSTLATSYAIYQKMIEYKSDIEQHHMNLHEMSFFIPYLMQQTTKNGNTHRFSHTCSY